MTGSAPPRASEEAFIAQYPDIIQKLSPLSELLKQGQGVSYTQWEAWLALYHGKPLVVAEATEAAPRGPKYMPTAESQVVQKAHLQYLRQFERYASKFTSPDNLSKIVLSSAILDLLGKATRPEEPQIPPSVLYPAFIAVLLLLLCMPLLAEQLARRLGISLAAPIILVSAIAGLALALVFWRYLGILGADEAGTERRDYDALRESLATGGVAVQLYSLWLTAFLNSVDRFFGDAGMTDKTFFARAFGLRSPAPLWTPNALDRCLLLALIYPVVTIFIIWTVSGHVGPAEAALGLKADLSGWRRGLAAMLLALATLSLRQVPAMPFTQWHVGPKRYIFTQLCIILAVGGAVIGGGMVMASVAALLSFMDSLPGIVAVGTTFVGAGVIPIIISKSATDTTMRPILLRRAF